MSGKAQEPLPEQEKQKTSKGYEIPVPKRGDLMSAFRRIVGPAKPLKKS